MPILETTILDEAAVSEIEARANAAIEGPFEVKPQVSLDGDTLGFQFGRYLNDILDADHWWTSESLPYEDAEFYAHAREDVPALCDTVKHLRERERTILAVNAELIEGNHAAHVTLDAAGIKREDVTWEGPIQHVTEYPVCDRIGFLQSQLEQLRTENERLRELVRHMQFPRGG